MKPHKHAEIIKAWADGAEIECKPSSGDTWTVTNPTWSHLYDYRIKPPLELKSKNDVISKYLLRKGMAAYLCSEGGNLKVVWDGETGELKSAEVLK